MNEVHDQVGGLLGVLGRKQKEVSGRPVKARHSTRVDTVRVLDDEAALRLAKDLVKLDHSHDPRIDDVLEYGPCPDTGQLIDVTHQKKVALRLDRLEQAVGQQHIQHAGLVDYDHVGFEGILLVPPKGKALMRFELQQAVDGLGLAAGGLR